MIRRYNLTRSDNAPKTGKKSYACSGNGLCSVLTGFPVTSAIITWASVPAFETYGADYQSMSSSSFSTSSSSSIDSSSSTSSISESSISSSSSSSSKEFTSSSSSINSRSSYSSLSSSSGTSSSSSGYFAKSFVSKGTAQSYFGLSMSGDGQYQTAITYGDKIYVSSDHGDTWTAKDSNRNWISVSVSSSGQYQVAIEEFTSVYLSSNYGNTWAPLGSLGAANYFDIAISGNGQYITTGVYGSGDIYVSNNYGATFSTKGFSKNWTNIMMSYDGMYQTAIPSGSNKIYVSSDYGATWSQKSTNASRTFLAMNKTGSIQITNNLVSYDYGNTWISYTPTLSSITGMVISDDSKYIMASKSNGIYVSDNYGLTWDKRSSYATNIIAMSDNGEYTSFAEFAYPSTGYLWVSSNTVYSDSTSSSSESSVSSVSSSSSTMSSSSNPWLGSFQKPRIYVYDYLSNGFRVKYENIPEEIGYIEFSYLAQ